MSNLNYEASFSQETGLTEMADDGNPVTPLSVNTTELPKPEIAGYRDYVPSATRRKMAEMQKQSRLEDKQEHRKSRFIPESGVMMGPPDYVSGEDSKAMRDERKKGIITEAKKIRQERKHRWAEYNKAAALLDDLKNDEDLGKKISSDPEVRKANAIVNAGKPPSTSKDACIEAARNRVLGLSD